ncbi:MAG: hypothetical protein IV100_11720 [Myxococcales bacterium]|nr:hypothetical protein [Myxococcales bacterium]
MTALGLLAAWGCSDQPLEALTDAQSVEGAEVNLGARTDADGPPLGTVTAALEACSVVGVGTSPPSGLTDVVSLAVGPTGSFYAVRSDNVLRVWGSAPPGVADNTSGVRAVAASDSVTVVLKTDGTVTSHAWDNSFGQTTVPAGTTGVVQVAAGVDAAYALRSDGTVQAWGQNSSGFQNITRAKAATGITAITANGYLAAGLKADGTVQVFLDTFNFSSYAPIGTATGVTQVVAMEDGFVALKGDGTLVSWPSSMSRKPPAALNGVHRLVSNGYHACAIKYSGKVVCWGADVAGLASVTSASDVWLVAIGRYGDTALYAQCPGCKAVPPSGCCDGDTLRVCSGSAIETTSCAAATCGANASASAYTCDTAGGSAPSLMPRSCPDYVCIPSCVGKGCGDDGCGGSCGTCPNGTTCDEGTGTCPVAALPATCDTLAIDLATSTAIPWTGGSTAAIVDYEVGIDYVLALRADGTVSLAGTAPGTLATAISGGTLTGVKAIAAGSWHALFVMADGSVRAYGDDTKCTPQALENIPTGVGPAVAVAAGDTQSYLLTSDGRTYAWGFNGPLLAVTGANNKSGFKAIAAAANMVIGLMNDGTVTSFREDVFPPTSLGSAKGIATDGYNYYALKADGALVAWGNVAPLKPALTITGFASAIGGGPHAFVALDGQGVIKTYGARDADFATRTKLDALLQTAKTNQVRGYSNLALGDKLMVVTRCPAACGSITVQGCCNDGALRTCNVADGTFSSTPCASGCGWTAAGFACTAAPLTTPLQPVAACLPECIPQCSGKNCGPDGCGGICGSCGATETCNPSGVCECVKLCAASNGCGSDGCGGTCGTCTGNGVCQAFGTPAPVGDPRTDPNLFFRVCQCVPDCTGKDCGPDGCGGSCGVEGDANPTCVAIDDFATYSCNQATGYKCACNAAKGCEGKTCGSDGCGGTCGTCSGSSECSCTDSLKKCQLLGKPNGSCLCTPDCTGKQCGSAASNADGCGGACWGELPYQSTLTLSEICAKSNNGWNAPQSYCDDATNTCKCTPKCQTADGVPHQCGNDGCGGTCGTCPGANDYCDYHPFKGTQLCQCVPQCDGKTCGPDGCGGTCPGCGPFDSCNEATGQCIACVPQCSGKTCGPDGCGGSCGSCPEQYACEPNGTCGACTPACSSKQCGDDGCGGKCGSCESDQFTKRTCVEYRDPFTSKVWAAQCNAKPICQRQCDGGKNCGPDYCGGVCGVCLGKDQCVDATTGVPTNGPGVCNCKTTCNELGSDIPEGQSECGQDGCGGTCGQCADGGLCVAKTFQYSISGQTISYQKRVCAPSCAAQCKAAGRECGKLPGATGLCTFAECGPPESSLNGNGQYCTPEGKIRWKGCPNTPLGGCCAGETFRTCTEIAPGVRAEKSVDCIGQNQQCTWRNYGVIKGKIVQSGFQCSPTVEATPATETRACPGEPVCVPKCDGRQCGSDGCGGSCGTCGAGESCNQRSGKCGLDVCGKLVTAQLDADGKPGACCAAIDTLITCETKTSAFKLEYCTKGCVSGRAADGSITPMCFTSAKDAVGLNECPAGLGCFPKCNGKNCGSDGCGGTCGTCGAGDTCTTAGQCCTPKCTAGTCGQPDGCGGTCPDTCPAGAYCDSYSFTTVWEKQNYQRRIPVYACSPGTDQCKAQGITEGGCCAGALAHTCSASATPQAQNCGSGEYCRFSKTHGRYMCVTSKQLQQYQKFPSSQLLGLYLLPDNFVMEDPSGKYPRICPATVPCTPSCSGRNCGDDGCGGSCGTCAAGGYCDPLEGLCYARADAYSPFEGCCDAKTGNLKKSVFVSGVYDWVEKPSSVSRVDATCAAGTCGWNAAKGEYGCNTSGASAPGNSPPKACPCEPKCAGKVCGDDGCGGTCGPACPAGKVCGDGACVTCNSDADCPTGKKCSPDRTQCYVAECAGKPCGVDQLGQSCGQCAGSTFCTAQGTCAPNPSCESVSWFGACLGETLYYCAGANKVVSEDCTKASPAGKCGWNPGLGAYSCGTSGGADPSGTHPIAYPSTTTSATPPTSCSTFNQCNKQVFTPEFCNDRPDGCGGWCASTCHLFSPKGVAFGSWGPYWGEVSIIKHFAAGAGSLWVGESRPANVDLHLMGSRRELTGFCGASHHSGVSLCGRNEPIWGGWLCQCDAACVDRGDCCEDYLLACACGNGVCDSGESCSTCGADCGACPAPPTSPPWASPSAVSASLTGNRAIAADVDALVPADAAPPRDGLLAYVPGPASLWGAAARTGLLGTGATKPGGSTATTPGVQGVAMRFGNAAQSAPSFGTHRVVLPGRVPRVEPGAKNLAQDGYSVALWLRVPTTAPASELPMAWLTAAEGAAEHHCVAGRPGDAAIGLKCTTPGTSIQRVSAFVGESGTDFAPGGIACLHIERARASATCSDAAVTGLLDSACVGKSTCVYTLPPPPACLGGAPADVMVRYECAAKLDRGLSLTVSSAADGGGLRFGNGDVGTDLKAPTSVRDGVWHHVVVTFASFYPNGTAGDFGLTSVYVDGVLSAQSSDRVRLGAGGFFDEVVLGAGALGAGVGDIDEVFVYGRTLTATEVARLRTKRDLGLLRVWPPVSAEHVVQHRQGVSAGSTTTAVTVNPRVHEVAEWRALVPATTYDHAQPDPDLSSLSKFTLAGWVRANTATPGTLIALWSGTTLEARIDRTSECAGLGLSAQVGSGSPLGGSACGHGLRTGAWQFVALVRDGTTQSLWLDGALVAQQTGAAPTALFAGNDPRRFSTGPGVALGWAGLFGRALTPSELERVRRPGPVVWMDGASWTDAGAYRLRDFGGLSNFTGASTSQEPLVRSSTGATVTIAPKSLGPIELGGGGQAPHEVLIPAEGRTGTTTASGVRPFSWVTRVNVGANPPASGIPLLTHATAAAGSWTPRLVADLVCSRSSGVLICNTRLVAQLGNGAYVQWLSEKRSAPVSGSQAVAVDVSLSWDGVAPTWSLASTDAPFSLGAAPASSGDVAVTSYVLPTVSAPANAPATIPAAAGITGTWFRVAPTATSGPISFGQIRLYNRALGGAEAGSVVRRTCDDLGCSGKGRVCTSGGTSGFPICGGCLPGYAAPSGVAPFGECVKLRTWGDPCQIDAQCTDGMCRDGTCRSPSVNADCTAKCLAKGRECVVRQYYSNVATSNDYTQCSATCLMYYTSPAEGADCVWTPIQAGGQGCRHDLACESGVCIQSESPYPNDPNGRLWDTGQRADDRDKLYWEDCTFPAGRATPHFATPPQIDNSSIPNLCDTTGYGRCLAPSAATCEEEHRVATVASRKGSAGEPLYECGKCGGGTFTGADGKAQPLYVERMRFGSFRATTLGGLAQGVLGKPEGAVVTPADIAKMITLGVGVDLIRCITEEDYRVELRRQLLRKYDLGHEKGWANYVPSYFEYEFVTDPHFNYPVCAPNQFPDGTQCPPPGTDPAQADFFCASGFCARDTGVCEEGYGRLEETEAADRRDEGEGDSSAGALDLIQTNNTTMEMKKVKSGTLAESDKQTRAYTFNARFANTLKFFGASQDVMSIRASLTGVMDGDKSGTYDASITLFGISQPNPPAPALGCKDLEWVDGKMTQTGSGLCEPVKPDAVAMLAPTTTVCAPAPGGCEEDPYKGTALKKFKEKGPLCRRQIFMAGPVPITVEIGVTIDVCFGYGVTIDPDTMEAGFQIQPSLGVGLEVKGGVGGGLGPLFEVFAGVRASITIVEIAFPIKWAFQMKKILEDAVGEAIQNMYEITFSRTVSAELTVLKVKLGVFAEMAVAVFLKLEWEFPIFSLPGLKFAWELSSSELDRKKIDLQHKTANQ